ncbi:hypothetical protein SPBR_08038 [Sporothrix brasiliensis 5110]|uniref:Uncharacterized protein n=1 Tax=Sporothrix brasiliensis 5110 TaxID=1398154 RepID=A0A0C2IP54_9PEZI|nr:uncharacterized protein SPBR_08038 [Sporothrix brasiliensis 5110]KIH88700.1 hypothetical protein SPBR_08038 [Sporothrix brasiliensis 5110]
MNFKKTQKLCYDLTCPMYQQYLQNASRIQDMNKTAHGTGFVMGELGEVTSAKAIEAVKTTEVVKTLEVIKGQHNNGEK